MPKDNRMSLELEEAIGEMQKPKPVKKDFNAYHEYTDLPSLLIAFKADEERKITDLIEQYYFLTKSA